eukprot:TRINITY_DN6105_c0_g1_i2.p1 TRINITY_DN6105_c0_g1~~TRINITY_DN6105_c0_g1_i2.p1  ORF type:complete len:155 (+),score=22.95 TRINITY_DN6105_c0_g1_i2:47-511(+)
MTDTPSTTTATATGNTDTVPLNPTTTFDSATQNVVFSMISSSLSSFKNDRLSEFRSISSFCDSSKFSLPGFTEIPSRLKRNILWFQTNYIVIVLLFSVYSVLTSPLFLISLIIVLCAWLYCFRWRKEPFQVMGREVPKQVIAFILLSCLLLWFY